MATKMGMREFKVIYTADQKRKGEVLIVATSALDAKQRAWHLLRMNGVPNPRCIKAIDNSKPTSGVHMKQFRVFYTANRPNGSRFEGEIVVEAIDKPDAKVAAKQWLDNTDQLDNVRNLQAIDNS